jgi:membrane fusion protein, multidrug efflux system
MTQHSRKVLTTHRNPAAAFLSVVLGLSGCGHKVAQGPPPPTPVEVTQVLQQDVPVTREWVATMDGLVNAQVRAQASGYLLRQRYRNGDSVQRGQPLFEIDARSLQAMVSEATAVVAQAQSILQQSITARENALAQRGKTELDVNRLRPLAEERAVSRQELDNAVQADLAARAQVAGANASIDAARSAIDAAKARQQTAELNLSFATVVSPVSGIAGISKAQVGDLVGPSTNELTTVSIVDPILVNFTISEQEYLQVSKWLEGKGAAGGPALQTLPFTLQLTDGSIYPHKGKLHAVNREVNAATGSIEIQTEFPNPGNTLRPGGFGRVSTAGGIERNALLVPQRSIIDVQGKHFVAVTGVDEVVHLRPVSTGITQGALQVIASGLQPGETVVVEGVQKVRDGMTVAPRPYQVQR